MMQKRKSFENRGKRAVLSVLIILCADIAFNIIIRQLTGAGYLSGVTYWSDVVLCVGVLAILACMIIAVVTYNDFRKNIVKPVNEFTAAISDLTHGRPAGKCAFQSDDEIGLLADGVRRLVERMNMDIVFFEQLRSGDYSQDLPGTPALGDMDAAAAGAEREGDKLQDVIQGMIDKQRDLVRSLQHSSQRIAVAAKDISDKSQSLAVGSSEQAAAIEEFSVTVDDIRQHAENNAKLAIDTMKSINNYSEIVRAVGNDMKLMKEKMNDMQESAARISSVSDIIENIAFQTNILALNAAVEAARAGQHGKGFAVVADEVKQLASKSAAAARETSELINVDMENVRMGNDIVEEAAAGMARIEKIADENERRMTNFSEASIKQSLSVSEISKSIGQISKVVQANSAIAEVSAASAQELMEQSRSLDAVVDYFTIERPSENAE
jgi:methyl-accepting chemotaxis protein